TRRHIKIMHRDRIAHAGALTEYRRDVATITLAAEGMHVERLERHARDHGDAVVALLSVDRDMLVAEALEALARKLVVRTLGLLQAEHVRAHRLHEFRHQVDAQPHRIDVPGGDRETHEGASSKLVSSE